MIAKIIQGWNTVFKKPDDWDEEANGKCIPIHARVDERSDTDSIVQTAWEPTPEELRILNVGGVVVLSCIGGMPPVMLTVEK